MNACAPPNAGTPCPESRPPAGISMIVPAYNEAAGIAYALGRLLAVMETLTLPWEVIVVDDGSKDGTRAILADFPNVRCIRHPINIGYGNALKTGIRNAAYPWIGICDADGSYPVEELPRLLAVMDQGFDMVTGARENLAEHDRWFKRQMRRIYIKSVCMLTGDKIPDPNSGLRVFTRELAMEFIQFLCGGFSFTTSLTILAAEKPCFMTYIPIRYEDRKGKSKVRHFRDSLRTLQLIVQGVTYFNPMKFFIIMAISMIGIIGFPAMVLAMFRMLTLSAYYMLFGCVVALLLAFGVLGDIVRISIAKLKQQT